jgi:hypothetical protein
MLDREHYNSLHINQQTVNHIASAMSNAQKRKRTVASYVHIDPLADLLGDDENITSESCHESSDDESDNDDRTYSRHKVCVGHGQESADRLTDQPRKLPRKLPRTKKQGSPQLAGNPSRNLSHSWNYRQNFGT